MIQLVQRRQERAAPRSLVRRHRLSTRIWHWLNALALFVMLMSGLMIFNAHPRLYWGAYGANYDNAWAEIGAVEASAAEGGAAGTRGVLRIGSHMIDTTGLLGLSRAPDGSMQEIAFPAWATIPSSYNLADARMWHLAFAWVLAGGLAAYLLWSLLNGHIWRDLRISFREWSPRHVWQDVKDHLRLRFPAGEAALHYSFLQKLAYGAVLFLLLPLVIATGLAMSPGVDAGLPWLVDVLGGRQSARSIHFLCAMGLVAFVVIHLAMVLLSGPLNQLRGMITGWYRLPRPRRERGA